MGSHSNECHIDVKCRYLRIFGKALVTEFWNICSLCKPLFVMAIIIDRYLQLSSQLETRALASDFKQSQVYEIWCCEYPVCEIEWICIWLEHGQKRQTALGLQNEAHSSACTMHVQYDQWAVYLIEETCVSEIWGAVNLCQGEGIQSC